MLFSILHEGSTGEINKEITEIYDGEDENISQIILDAKVNQINKIFNYGEFKNHNYIKHSKLLEIKKDFLSNLKDNFKPSISKLNSENRLNIHCIIENEINISQKWYRDFKDTIPKSNIFFLDDGNIAETNYMFQSNILGRNNIQYCNDELFQAVSIPFQDEEIRFEILLPHENVGINKLLLDLNESKIINLKNKFRDIDRIEVVIPKFQFKNVLSLKEESINLNIENLFQETHDFDKMILSPDTLFLKDIFQSNFINLDLEGLTVKSKSVAIFGIGSMAKEPDNYILFEANRPFLFIIREINSNSILQIGLLKIPNEVAASDKFILDKNKVLARKRISKIRKIKPHVLDTNLRGLLYLGLICLNKILKKYSYAPNELKKWFKDVLKLISYDFVVDEEVYKLNFWSHEKMTGFPYDSQYLPEKDYLSFQNKYPEISKTVESLCSLLYHLRGPEETLFFKSTCLREFEVFLTELVEYNLEFPDLDMLQEYKINSDNIIGDNISVNFQLLDEIIKK